jgi:hypothetical protein
MCCFWYTRRVDVRSARIDLSAVRRDAIETRVIGPIALDDVDHPAVVHRQGGAPRESAGNHDEREGLACCGGGNSTVGHFAHAILDGKNGYLAEAADISSMEKTMEKFINHPISEEIVAGFKKNLSWEKYVESIRGND